MMAGRRRILAGVLAGLVLAGAGTWAASRCLDGPWGMLPGGPFSQASIPCDGWDLAALSRVREVELEVHAERPRSITTWSVVHGDALYLPADFLTPWKRWPDQVLADPRVRLRVQGQVYACRAERVTEPERIAELRRAISSKYAIDPEGRAARVEVWWFRLGPR